MLVYQHVLEIAFFNRVLLPFDTGRILLFSCVRRDRRFKKLSVCFWKIWGRSRSTVRSTTVLAQIMENEFGHIPSFEVRYTALPGIVRFAENFGGTGLSETTKFFGKTYQHTRYRSRHCVYVLSCPPYWLRVK